MKNDQNKKTNWQTKKLGDILDIERGGSPRPINSFLTDDENGINWIKIGDTKNVNKYIEFTKQKIKPEGLKKSRLVKEGDFILSNSMSFGRPYIMKTTGAIHDGWLVLRPKTKNINQDFLYLILGSPLIFRQFDNLAAGSTVRNLNIGLVKSVQIPIPPLPEQKRIVKILDGVFADVKKAKENAEKNLANAKELFESYLQSVFENPGKDSSSAKATADKWEEKKLGEVCEKTENIKWNEHKEKEFNYVDLSAVSRDNLKIENSVIINYKSAPSRAKKIIKTNNIIFATTRPTLKRIAKIYSDFNNQICSTGFVVLRAKKEKIISDIIYYFLQTNTFMDSMEKLQRGASYPAVSDNDVKNQILKFPKSLTTQKQIVKKLDELSAHTKKLEAVYQQKIDDLEELKKSVLKKAFEGEL